MNDLATLARLLENLIRLGTIAEVDHGDPAQQQPPRVRVQTGTLLTAWLPWLTPRAGADREWNPPTIGEQVILLSPSGQLANGVAICGLFSDLIPANGDRAALHRTTYRDGAVIEYDSAAHHLRAILPATGTTELESLGGISIKGDISHQGNYSQTGNQTITGAVSVTDDVTANGISLVNHRHGGVQPGAGTTGTPQ
jgi:phage baseplate assembly protein V